MQRGKNKNLKFKQKTDEFKNKKSSSLWRQCKVLIQRHSTLYIFNNNNITRAPNHKSGFVLSGVFPWQRLSVCLSICLSVREKLKKLLIRKGCDFVKNVLLWWTLEKKWLVTSDLNHWPWRWNWNESAMILSAFENRLRAGLFNRCDTIGLQSYGIRWIRDTVPIDSSQSCVLQLPMTAGCDQSDWLTD